MKETMKYFAVIFVVGCLVTPMTADIIIADEDAFAVFDIDSQAGMKNWTIGNVNHMTQQWFWYRIGDTGGESSIDTIATPLYMVSDIDDNPGDGLEKLLVLYATNQFTMELSYTITGSEPGSNTSTINEDITITNLSDEELDFSFFQYCNLDLGGTAFDTSAEIVGQNTANQIDVGSAFASECADTPSPNCYEVNYVPAILTSLNDAVPTTLSNTAGPLNNGDLSWAFEWEFTLDPVTLDEFDNPIYDVYQISKVKAITPEPATLGLLAIGGICLLRRRRCRA